MEAPSVGWGSANACAPEKAHKDVANLGEPHALHQSWDRQLLLVPVQHTACGNRASHPGGRSSILLFANTFIASVSYSHRSHSHLSRRAPSTFCLSLLLQKRSSGVTAKLRADTELWDEASLEWGEQCFLISWFQKQGGCDCKSLPGPSCWDSSSGRREWEHHGWLARGLSVQPGYRGPGVTAWIKCQQL